MVGVAYRGDSVLAVPDKRRDLGMGASAHRETSHIRPTQIVKNGPQNPGLLSSPSPRRAEAIKVHEVLFAVVRMVIASLGVPSRAALNGAANGTIF